jgi:exonuclease SbcD
MRFLHTADWHVGKTLAGRSRLVEQEQVSTEIVDIAKRERIDCVLLAGDIFDSPAPSVDAQRVVCDTLAEIAGAGMAAVMVGGNHDYRRLSALRKLAGRLDIFIRPSPRESDEGGVMTYCESQSHAADALQVLQGGKRLIGVITHVQALADQMPARIEIQRTLSGSRVKYCSG